MNHDTATLPAAQAHPIYHRAGCSPAGWGFDGEPERALDADAPVCPHCRRPHEETTRLCYSCQQD